MKKKYVSPELLEASLLCESILLDSPEKPNLSVEEDEGGPWGDFITF